MRSSTGTDGKFQSCGTDKVKFVRGLYSYFVCLSTAKILPSVLQRSDCFEETLMNHNRYSLASLQLGGESPGNANDVLGWHGATFAGALGRCDKVANGFDQFICRVRSE